MVTKRELKSKLKCLHNPPPMSMEDALASANPDFEISIRIRGDVDQLNPAERLYWEASYFLGDTLNGGLIQTLSNDTGSLTDKVHHFAEKYCDPRLAKLFAELKSYFPDGNIPTDREVRNDLIDKLSNNLENDPFSELTIQFYALREEFTAGLLKLAANRSSEFQGLQITSKEPLNNNQQAVDATALNIIHEAHAIWENHVSCMRYVVIEKNDKSNLDQLKALLEFSGSFIGNKGRNLLEIKKNLAAGEIKLEPTLEDLAIKDQQLLEAIGLKVYLQPLTFEEQQAYLAKFDQSPL